VTERIVAVACNHAGLTISLPAPARHCHVIRAMDILGWYDESRAEIEQGFVTSTGRFVDRDEAGLIATAAGQLIPREGRHPNVARHLFSEDVW
jgi:hypothetical protein